MADNLNVDIIWEWNPITGDPFIPPADTPNARHASTIDEMSVMADPRNTIGPIAKTRLRNFLLSNETILTVVVNARGGDEARAYLRFLRLLDLKKIRLEYRSGGFVTIEKLPRNTHFNGEPDGITNHLRTQLNHSVYGLVEDINHNALLGWVGPGTFPCWVPNCNSCVFVGRSPTVNLGPHGVLPLTKRAYCNTKNAVYVGTCRQCQEDGSFACYFGESRRPLRSRIRQHSSIPCSVITPLRNRAAYPTVADQRAEIARVINAGVDPQGILRDWFAHVTEQGIHPGQQQISVVDIVANDFRRKNRERFMVEQHMFNNDDFHYLGMGRGCLNSYHPES